MKTEYRPGKYWLYKVSTGSLQGVHRGLTGLKPGDPLMGTCPTARRPLFILLLAANIL